MHVYHTPTSTKLKWGYTGFMSICLSVHLSIHLWRESCLLYIFHNTNQIHFLFTHLSNHFRKCVICKIVCKILKSEFCAFCFKFVTLTVLFRFGIWYESMVWVIMRRWGIFTECRCFNWSNYFHYGYISYKLPEMQMNDFNFLNLIFWQVITSKWKFLI